MTLTKVKLRIGIASDADTLSALAIRAKAFWPYDAEFIQDCAEELEISSARAAGGLIFVAEYNEFVVGFCGFCINETEPEMTHLFVEPKFIGMGIGKLLWNEAIAFAKIKKWASFKIVADPFAAEKFYFGVGCKKIGEIDSSIRPGRKLPLLQFDIK